MSECRVRPQASNDVVESQVGMEIRCLFYAENDGRVRGRPIALLALHVEDRELSCSSPSCACSVQQAANGVA